MGGARNFAPATGSDRGVPGAGWADATGRRAREEGRGSRSRRRTRSPRRSTERRAVCDALRPMDKPNTVRQKIHALTAKGHTADEIVAALGTSRGYVLTEMRRHRIGEERGRGPKGNLTPGFVAK